MSELDPSFFARSPVDVAPRLLGLVVTHAGVSVRITEVEAYHGAQDPGSHGFRRRTERNSALFGPPGTAYVYINYGIHRALNIVCGADGESAGCLIRSGEVIEGIETARRRRTIVTAQGETKTPPDHQLARGPGNLAKTLAIEPDLGGTPVTGPDAQIVLSPAHHRAPSEQGTTAATHLTGPRVGVSGPGGDGEAYPWRFWLPGERSVSAYRPGGVKRRRSSTPAAAKGADAGVDPT